MHIRSCDRERTQLSECQRREPKATSTHPARASTTYHLLLGAQHTQLPEAHMERGALEGVIGLPHHDHIDAARQGGRVQPLVQLLHGDEDGLSKLPHVVHCLELQGRERNRLRWGERAVAAR